jgi:hypothetical protein
MILAMKLGGTRDDKSQGVERAERVERAGDNLNSKMYLISGMISGLTSTKYMTGRKHTKP